MRIAIVTDTYCPDVNGVAMTLGRLVDGLRAAGNLVYVIHTGKKSGSGESIMKSIPLPGYTEVRIGLPGKSKLASKWTKKRPDVIYVATESPLGYSAIKAAQKLGIPVAAGFHTNFHHYIHNYRMGKIEQGAMNYLRRVHVLADCTIVPTEGVRQMLLEDGFTNIKVVGRGVDTLLFSPQKRCAKLRASWGARATTPVAMIVGRVAPEKNLPFAMQVFGQMQNEVPGLVCIAVGDGPQRAVLEQEYGSVQFTGAKSGEDLAKHYASADIVIFPSESETFGNVLLEGMASGAVVIAYNYAAASQHVICGKNGLLAMKGDENEFIRQAIRSLQLCEHGEIRRRARESAEKIGWRAVTERFEGHLRELLEESGKARGQTTRRKRIQMRTLILSDIHLGTDDSKAREVIDVLKRVRCQRIILNGDIIDVWALKRGKKWRNIHTRVIRTLLKKMEKEQTEIIYLRGNHDDFMTRFLPITLDKLRCAKEYILTSAKGKKYLVLHGDGFDSVSTGHRWIAVVGSIGYDALLKVNRVYNRYRELRGKEHYSVSKAIKSKVKSAVNFISRYEDKLVELACKRGCSGIICGHIHTPCDEIKQGVHYLNSGDWVETMSCIVEDIEGNFSMLYYEDVVEMTLPDPVDRKSASTYSGIKTFGRDQFETADRAALNY